MSLYLGVQEEAIRDAGGKLKFNTGWSLFLFVLKELHNRLKLCGDGFSAAFRELPLAIYFESSLLQYIILLGTQRGAMIIYGISNMTAIDFESRRHLVAMMFPGVKDDNDKLHKLLIDRSLLFKESFELIAYVKPESLHNGIFVEFKDEVAAGHGVLLEWLLLVCQALFSPENSLSVECLEDPAQLKLFSFCGRVIALAVMHKVKVGIAFDRVISRGGNIQIYNTEDSGDGCWLC